jgi:hypothetical protein
LRSTGLDEADVARREPRVHGQIELTHASGIPPVAQHVADLIRLLPMSCGSNGLHVAILRPHESHLRLPLT